MEYALILLNNNRSKSYLQNLIRAGFPPSETIVLGKNVNCSRQEEKILCSHGVESYFDENEEVFRTLRENGLHYKIVPTLNANDKSVVAAVADLGSKHLIYSGPGGVILKKDVLSQGVSFYHAHPGLVPQYKGSTAFYYSMLLRGKIGCSIIEMSEQLDGGDVMFRKEYSAPTMPTDYDRVVDPLLRTETLLSWLKSIDWNFSGAQGEKQGKSGNMFYIIHPVLKHLSILNMETSSDEV